MDLSALPPAPDPEENSPSFVNLGFARVDTDRRRRCGFPEVIFCQGKTSAEVAAIARTILAHDPVVLGTRATPEQFAPVAAEFPMARYHERARCIVVEREPLPRVAGTVGVICAGTSDLPVAEEAAVTLETFGNAVDRISDVGVAGIHRLLAVRGRLDACRVLVVVAGMEGALPSVVAGLVDVPVIAVPTSIGYGASFGGLAALLGMLNSCGSGVTVVNIDNGFGAAYAAATINRLSPVCSIPPMNIVHHLALNCRDRLAQEAFYVEHFGFKRARILNAGQADEFIMLRLGGMCLELFNVAEKEARGGVQAVGFKHLAFEVPSIEASIAKLRAAGIESGRIIDASDNVPGLRICFFDDPEGNSIELMEGWQDA